MIEVRKTDVFGKWLDGLGDIRARARIMVRIDFLNCGSITDPATGFIILIEGPIW